MYRGLTYLNQLHMLKFKHKSRNTRHADTKMARTLKLPQHIDETRSKPHKSLTDTE